MTPSTKSPTKRLAVVKAALIALATLPLLQGCASLGIDTDTPGNVKTFAGRVPVVQNSPRSPCWQQRQIAKQQAFLEAAKTGEDVVRTISKECQEPKTS